LRVLDHLGATDVPVYAGSGAPLVGDACDAAYWHGTDGLGGARLPASSRTVQPDGVEWLCAYAAGNPGAVTIVCTGPCTVLAEAIQRDPTFASNVKEVVVMGGAARLPGHTTPVAEFNVYADPEAAALVFQQDWPLVMVGLDVTQQVQLSRQETLALASLESPEARLITEVTRFLFLESLNIEAMSLHDPLAVAVALEPSLVTTVSTPVVVETRGEYTRGQTIVDWRRGRPVPPSNTRVCVEVDVVAARKFIFETLLSG
jgi:purine nucleosidase